MPEKLKKHPCKDCFSCQNCGDDRCKVCRDETGSSIDETAKGWLNNCLDKYHGHVNNPDESAKSQNSGGFAKSQDAVNP